MQNSDVQTDPSHQKRVCTNLRYAVLLLPHANCLTHLVSLTIIVPSLHTVPPNSSKIRPHTGPMSVHSNHTHTVRRRYIVTQSYWAPLSAPTINRPRRFVIVLSGTVFVVTDYALLFLRCCNTPTCNCHAIPTPISSPRIYIPIPKTRL
jgi:hypothetical protein